MNKNKRDELITEAGYENNHTGHQPNSCFIGRTDFEKQLEQIKSQVTKAICSVSKLSSNQTIDSVLCVEDNPKPNKFWSIKYKDNKSDEWHNGKGIEQVLAVHRVAQFRVRSVNNGTCFAGVTLIEGLPEVFYRYGGDKDTRLYIIISNPNIYWPKMTPMISPRSEPQIQNTGPSEDSKILLDTGDRRMSEGFISEDELINIAKWKHLDYQDREPKKAYSYFDTSIGANRIGGNRHPFVEHSQSFNLGTIPDNKKDNFNLWLHKVVKQIAFVMPSVSANKDSHDALILNSDSSIRKNVTDAPRTIVMASLDSVSNATFYGSFSMPLTFSHVQYPDLLSENKVFEDLWTKTVRLHGANTLLSHLSKMRKEKDKSPLKDVARATVMPRDDKELTDMHLISREESNSSTVYDNRKSSYDTEHVDILIFNLLCQQSKFDEWVTRIRESDWGKKSKYTYSVFQDFDNFRNMKYGLTISVHDRTSDYLWSLDLGSRGFNNKKKLSESKAFIKHSSFSTLESTDDPTISKIVVLSSMLEDLDAQSTSGASLTDYKNEGIVDTNNLYGFREDADGPYYNQTGLQTAYVKKTGFGIRVRYDYGTGILANSDGTGANTRKLFNKTTDYPWVFGVDQGYDIFYTTNKN